MNNAIFRVLSRNLRKYGIVCSRHLICNKYKPQQKALLKHFFKIYKMQFSDFKAKTSKGFEQ